MKTLSRETKTEMDAMLKVLNAFSETLNPDEWLDVLCRSFLERGGHSECSPDQPCPLAEEPVYGITATMVRLLKNLEVGQTMLVLGGVLCAMSMAMEGLIQEEQRKETVHRRAN